MDYETFAFDRRVAGEDGEENRNTGESTIPR